MADVTTCYLYKEGSVQCECFLDVPAGASQITLTHHLGQVPDIVLITPKTQYHVFESAARTATNVSLTGTTGTSTCDVVLKVVPKGATVTEVTA